MKSYSLSILLIGLLGYSPEGEAPGKDETRDRSEKHQADEALTLVREAAATYEFLRSPDNPSPDDTRAATSPAGSRLAFYPQPILQWSNPVAGSIYGNVFLWTNNGQPEVIGSLYKWYSPFTHMSHEFCSLSSSRITGTRHGRQVWRTQRPGVEWKPVPEMLLPAGTVTGRSYQMRALARQFSAEKTDRERVRRSLRLLTQPVYRYQNPEVGVIDGAIFAFAQGTDPEVLLLLEARTTKQTSQWRYALARMKSVEFQVAYGGREIWSVPILPWNQVKDHGEPYTVFAQTE